MRIPRIKLDPSETEAAYHCMTRCVEAADKLDPVSREVLRRMLWKVAYFCGVEVITYAIMPNHFHVLVKIPLTSPINDDELMRRYLVLHPKPDSYQAARPEVIVDWLRRNTAEGVAWRNQQLALMGDLSSFMKLLKQRFTQWYNVTHKRIGTLWAERFKSVLVQYRRETLRTMAAYIDLNPVRKGLVSDPKDYRWCGYAEALAGAKPARQGLHQICPRSDWAQTHADYRLLLYSTGAAPRLKGRSINTSAFTQVMTQDGALPLAEVLRHRWNYLTYGAVLGSAAFVAEQSQRLPTKRSTSAESPPQAQPPPSVKTPPATPWGNWHVLHKVRQNKRA